MKLFSDKLRFANYGCAALALALLAAGCVSSLPPPSPEFLRHTQARKYRLDEIPPASRSLTEDEMLGEWEMSQTEVEQTTVVGWGNFHRSKNRAITITFTGNGQCTATLYDHNTGFTNDFHFEYANGRMTFLSKHSPNRAFWFLDASRFEVVNHGGDFFELRYLDLPLYSKQQLIGSINRCTSSYLPDGSLRVAKYLDSVAQVWEYTYSPMIFRRIGARPPAVAAGGGNAPAVRPVPARSKPATPAKAAAPKKPARHKEKVLYDVVSLTRKMDGDFSYRFELALSPQTEWSLKTVKEIKRDFRKAIRDDYAESFVGASAASVYVEFPSFMFDEGKIAGRAAVVCVEVQSMRYDPHSRTGHLSVRVDSGRFEEARKWIRKNIEVLARDKNIALVTGEIPPAAKFYLGRETLKDGNVLEIEFKTE